MVPGVAREVAPNVSARGADDVDMGDEVALRVASDAESRTSKHTEMHRERFSKHCHGNDCRDGEESSFFDCCDEQSDILQQTDPGHRTHRSLYPMQKVAFQ